MRKIIVTILAVLSAILACVFFWLKGQGDYTPPVISFPHNEITFTEGEDKDILLKGVTAIDETDGDVSDTLVVESVIPMRDELRATVIYYAKDKSNNVGKATRTVRYLTEETKEWAKDLEEGITDGQKQGETNEQEGENKTETGDVTPQKDNGSSQVQDKEDGSQQNRENSPAAEGKKEEKSTPQGSQDEEVLAGDVKGEDSQAGETQEEESNAEQPESEAVQEEELPEGSPRVTLKTDQVEVARGSKANFLNYVEEITDDKDEKSWLWHQIYITGLKDINLDVPGTYELYYTVTDSDRNVSNRAKLTVVVK